MRNKTEVLAEIFNAHGKDAVYVTNTGYLSRDVYAMFPENENIFYMQGSMGLSPAIALGISLGTDKDVIALVGDASLLMHLGITHTLRDSAPKNLYVYVLDNGMHESVGQYHCSHLEEEYPGITKIYKIKPDVKNDRVGIDFETNASAIKRNING
jgi:thiamine pyrophosphate-dependent acetolactate synthase large subunit-like protein